MAEFDPTETKLDEVERRTHTVEMHIRAAALGKKNPTMEGYAANFNSLSEDLGGFREILVQGCFKNALATSDIRALFNHNPDKILGRNTSGTCRISEDERGLKFEIDPPDTTYAKDLQVSMQRGDVTQCSFGFRVADGGDTWRKEPDGTWLRSIIEVDRLYDVSPVTYPAYASTSCAVRSLMQKQNDLELEEKRKLEEDVENERAVKAENEKRRLELEEVE